MNRTISKKSFLETLWMTAMAFSIALGFVIGQNPIAQISTAGLLLISTLLRTFEAVKQKNWFTVLLAGSVTVLAGAGLIIMVLQYVPLA